MISKFLKAITLTLVLASCATNPFRQPNSDVQGDQDTFTNNMKREVAAETAILASDKVKQRIAYGIVAKVFLAQKGLTGTATSRCIEYTKLFAANPQTPSAEELGYVFSCFESANTVDRVQVVENVNKNLDGISIKNKDTLQRYLSKGEFNNLIHVKAIILECGLSGPAAWCH